MALSTTEAELIALSSALCEVIHLQHLLQELCSYQIPVPFTKPQVHCQTFKDNAAWIEVALSDAKIHPHTKHMAIQLFHFRDRVEKGLITIEHVSLWEQLTDIFTKPLPCNQFRCLHDSIMGWASNLVMVYKGV